MQKDNRIHILELLAKYKFLCRSQFSELGFIVSRNHFTNLMKSLTEKSVNFVGQKKFGYHPKYGKVEDLYFLKPKGKKYLINEHNRDPETIHLPLWSNLFWNDYHHRKETINIRIQIEKEARAKGFSIEFYDMYFTWRSIPWKKWRACSTSIEIGNGTIKADSIFLVKTPKGREALYCLEFHNGNEAKRIVEQLKRYVKALAIGSPCTKYGESCWSLILNIFINKVTLWTVKEIIYNSKYFKEMLDHFIFIWSDWTYLWQVENNLSK